MDALFCGLYSVVCAFVFIHGSALLLKLVLSHLTTKQLTFLVRESEKIGSRHPPRFALLWLYTCRSLRNSEDEKIGTHVSVLATHCCRLHGHPSLMYNLYRAAEQATKDDEEDEMADVDTVCKIKIIGVQLNPMDPGMLAGHLTRDQK